MNDPHRIDPASDPTFLEAVAELPGDDALFGARLWEHHRSLLPARFIPLIEIDEPSKELVSRRALRCAAELRDFLRSYSAVPDAADAAKEYAAFEQAFHAKALALIGGEVAQAITRALEVDPNGRARIDPERFEVKMVLTEEGRWQPSWKASIDPQDVRRGRAAWMIAYARSREFEGLAAEERAELERVADMGDDEAIGDATMRTLEYLFERLQPGWAKLNTEEGRQEVLAQSLQQARAIAERLLADPRSGKLSTLERAFLAEFPTRPDEDLLPPIVAAVWRVYEQVIVRGQRDDAREMLGWINSNQRKGLEPHECAVLDQLGAAPEDAQLTPFVLSDLEVLHDKVLDAVEAAV